MFEALSDYILVASVALLKFVLNAYTYFNVICNTYLHHQQVRNGSKGNRYVFILLDMLIFYLNIPFFIFNTFSWRENNAIFMACFLDEQDL